MEHASFFGQLRRLAGTLDREVQGLEKSVNDRSTTASEGSAMLVLRDVQQEIDSLKSDVEISVSQLRGSSLLKLADASQNLAAKQQVVLHEIENYLCKYGYKPLENTNDEACHDEDEGQDGTYTIASADGASQFSHMIQSGIPTTPKTPRLEDFGINSDRLQQIRQLTTATKPVFEGVKNSGQTSNVFKMPSANYVRSGEMSTPVHIRDGNQEVHNPFEEDVVVTPVLMGGRPIPCMTPKSINDTVVEDSASPIVQAKLRTPQRQKHESRTANMYLHHPEFKSPTSTCTSKSRNVFSQPMHVTSTRPLKQVASHSKNSDDPPTPPVFLTKSFRQMCITPEKVAALLTQPKQFKQIAHDGSPESPEIPVFNTPGIPQIKRPEINTSKIPMASLETSCIDPLADNDSPVPPVLVTPGVKQIKKALPDIKQPKFHTELFRDDDDDDNLPTPPELLTKDFSKFAMNMHTSRQAHTSMLFIRSQGSTEMRTPSSSTYIDSPATPQLPPRLVSLAEKNKENIPPLS